LGVILAVTLMLHLESVYKIYVDTSFSATVVQFLWSQESPTFSNKQVSVEIVVLYLDP